MLQPLLQQQRIVNLEQQVKQLLEQQKRMLEHIAELTDIVISQQTADE